MATLSERPLRTFQVGFLEAVICYNKPGGIKFQGRAGVIIKVTTRPLLTHRIGHKRAIHHPGFLS